MRENDDRDTIFFADGLSFRYGLRYDSKDGYDSENGWILRNFSCSLASGEIMAVLGPNGCGKTTLLKLLLGTLKPVGGKIRCVGNPGYVPQVSASAFDYRVLEMVVMGRAANIGFFSIPGEKDYRCARAALSRLGLSDLAERNCAHLSGGQRQLVLIARALVSNPRCLVLDEPTSALDFKNQDLILSTLRQLAKEGLGVVMTTHAPHHALHIATHVLAMEGGGRCLYGPSDRVMANDRLRRLYGLEMKTLHFRHENRLVRTVVPLFS
ncbi:MAG: ABC transporter ATP-binding protein [Synergistaceae bacterium]|nr:ABC transporter ATP-binding protein [Synergistaceae bacterium]